MQKHRFGPAYPSEQLVYGAERPGYDEKHVCSGEVESWVRFMHEHAITGVVCLLSSHQLSYYEEDLVERYEIDFGSTNVLHMPIDDYHLAALEQLHDVVTFVQQRGASGAKTVVHCSAGIGRTGLVLAGWLVHARGFSPVAAIQSLKSSQPSRNPLEAVGPGGTTREDVIRLLDRLR